MTQMQKVALQEMSSRDAGALWVESLGKFAWPEDVRNSENVAREVLRQYGFVNLEPFVWVE